MESEKKIDSGEIAGSSPVPCSALPWVDAARHPLADVEDHKYTIFAGYEDLRLFAIRLRRGDFEYQLGMINDDGTILDVDGKDTGRQVWDADFYVKISKPNVESSRAERSEGVGYLDWLGLIKEWEQCARARYIAAESETVEWKKKDLESKALIYLNCATQVKGVLESLCYTELQMPSKVQSSKTSQCP